ncbi:MAG: glycosyltransferase family 39 protein [Cyanobacteria bacterium J06642_3]
MPVLPLLIFLVSLGLRLWDVTHPINVDEALWMFRGATFMRRLLEGDLAGTYLRHHPGVTNMWLIGTGHLISSGLHQLFPQLLGITQSPFGHSCFHEYSCPISLWIAPRVVQGLITSTCMVAFYVLSKKLFGQAIALCATGLLLVEPFFLAYQRFITTDALQADFSILAVLLLMLYLQEKGRWWQLVMAGICWGLAIASKIPALFIGGAAWLWIVVIELGWWQTRFPRRGWLRQIRDLFLWGLVALAVVVTLWPALWVNPVETLQKLYADVAFESIRGNLFFLGEYTDKPGLLFYPLILLYRLSPILQLGIVACLVALVMPKSSLKRKSELWGLTIVTLVVLGLLSTSDTKVGRYIVVVIPELAILAAFGYGQIWNWLVKLGDRIKSSSSSAKQSLSGDQHPQFRQLSIFLIVIQIVFLVGLCPIAAPPQTGL